MALDPNINRIKFLRTSTPGKAPVLNTEITEGELAINMADHTLYSANSNEVFRFGDPDRVPKSNIFASNFAKHYDVAARFSQGSAKGALVIFLPAGKYDSTTMMKFTITGYNYMSNTSWSLDLGGYNHSSTSWYNTFATYSGSKFAPFLSTSIYNANGAFVRYDPLAPEVARTMVKFGQTTTGVKRNVIVIGKVDDTYQYPTIVIDNLLTSNLGVDDKWLEGWEIGFINDQATLDSYSYSMAGGLPYIYGDNIAAAAEKFFIEDLGTGVNLNDVTVPGPYRCRTNAVSATITNTPAGENTAFSLMVEQAAYQKQTITYYRDGATNLPGNTYVRTSTGDGTGWTLWRQISYTDTASTGNAATATKWSTPTTFNFTGDTTGSVTFDGSETNKAIPMTTALATSLRMNATISNLDDVKLANSVWQNGNGNQNGPFPGAFKVLNLGPEQWNTQLFSPAYQNGLWVRTRLAASSAFRPWQKLAFGDQRFNAYSSSQGWYKIATVNLPTNGKSVTIKMVGGAGFNTGNPRQSAEYIITVNATNTAKFLNVVLTRPDGTEGLTNVAYKPSDTVTNEYDIIFYTGSWGVYTVTERSDEDVSVELSPSGVSLGVTLPTDFVAGTVRTMATTSSSIAGNAASATKLQTARTINGVAFDGQSNITIADATKLPLAGGTVTGALTVNGKIISLDTISGRKGVGGSSITVTGFNSDSIKGIHLYETGENIREDGQPAYGLYFATSNQAGPTPEKPKHGYTGKHGAITGGFSTYFINSIENNNTDIRGWIYQRNKAGVIANVASIDTNGNGVFDGTVTASKFIGDIEGTISGNATTATRLQTPRNINGVSFDGTRDITITDDTKLPLAGGTISGNLAVNGNVLTSQINGSAAPLAILSGSAARGINVGQLLVSNQYADVSKVPTSGAYIRGGLVVDGGITGTNLSLGGNAASASQLQTARSISMTGDGAWTTTFNGSTNVTGAMTLANTGVVAGTHKAVTVDAKGRATAGVAYTVGLVTSTGNTGTTNTATNNTNTFLNVVETLGGAASSVGSSQKIQGAGTVTVASDASGNITITGAQAITGNAGTATALQTARTFSITGAATAAAVSFNGTQNVALNVTSLNAANLTGTASINTTGSAAKWTTATTLNFTGAATGSVSIDGSETSKNVAMSILPATTSQVGIVKLNDTLTSTNNTEALTARQGKVLNDKINQIFNTAWYDETAAHQALGSNPKFTNNYDHPITVLYTVSYGGGSNPPYAIVLGDKTGTFTFRTPGDTPTTVQPGDTYQLINSDGGGWNSIHQVIIIR